MKSAIKACVILYDAYDQPIDIDEVWMIPENNILVSAKRRGIFGRLKRSPAKFYIRQPYRLGYFKLLVDGSDELLDIDLDYGGLHLVRKGQIVKLDARLRIT